MRIELNLTPLKTSPYIPQEERSRGQTKIYRYVLRDTTTDSVRQAVECITNLLKQNPLLIFVSPSNKGENLSDKVTSCHYLVINGKALCLSKRNKADENLEFSCKDTFFSEADIKYPIQCSNGHRFEQTYIRNWVEGTGNDICPYIFPTHSVGILQVDPIIQEEHQSKINNYYRDKKEKEKVNQKIEEIQTNCQMQAIAINQLLEGRSPSRTFEIAGGTLKVGFKAVKEGGESFLQMSGRKIPFISVIVGIICASYRAYQGYETQNSAEYYKAFGEILSGFIACLPGVGTAVSMGIDSTMLAHDTYEIFFTKDKVQLTLESAHAVLGIPMEKGKQISRQYIEGKYREACRRFNPNQLYKNLNNEELKESQAMINNAKEMLLKYYEKQTSEVL